MVVLKDPVTGEIQTEFQLQGTLVMLGNSNVSNVFCGVSKVLCGLSKVFFFFFF